MVSRISLCQESYFLDIQQYTLYTYADMVHTLIKYGNLILVLVLLTGSGWIWLSRVSENDTTQENISAPHKGFLAPDFSLVTGYGESISLSDLRGQVILLNIWASWCSPCRFEMPTLQNIYQEKASQGFTVLAVNAANQDERAAALAFADEIGLTFEIVFDEKGAVSKLYQVRALPTSYLIDSKGVIQEVIIGGPISEALLLIKVTELLAAKKEPKTP